MSGFLDLRDADLKGFEALEAGRYLAEIFEIKWDAVKNASGTGKMPAGTPMLKVHFKILANSQGESEGFLNRRVFRTYVNPPKDYDPQKAARMRGDLVKFFIGTGDAQDKVMGAKFDPDLEDYVGRQVAITINKKPKVINGETVPDEYNNEVTGVKPADSLGSVGDSSGLL